MRLFQLFWPLLPLIIAAPAWAGPKPAADSVLVIGALHELHASEPAFGYDRLRAAIIAYAPDVLVLEVRPDELAERKVTPGRPEYPSVIWPLLTEMQIETAAMEPGGTTFEEIAGQAGAAFDALTKANPDGAAALTRFEILGEEILLNYWSTAAQVQDATTASLAAGVETAQFAVAGPDFANAQKRWDAFMADQVLQSLRANPTKRIMVIGSYKNRALLEQAVREAAPQRIIVASEWFEPMEPSSSSN